MSVHRPNRITFFDLRDNVLHVDTFETMEDASRVYGNMCRIIKENGTDVFTDEMKGKIHKITLSTVYSETVI